jgi:hypothetical protein
MARPRSNDLARMERAEVMTPPLGAFVCAGRHDPDEDIFLSTEYMQNPKKIKTF